MARLRQICLNLLSNAVKYTRQGTIIFRVKGEPRNDGTILLFFSVIDTGIGIKSEDMPKLFSNFSQVDTHRNRSIEGTGLGLAITRNLCRLMDGDVTIESEYGKGSTFTAFVPQRVLDSRPFGSMAGETLSLEDRKQVELKFTAPGARVLAVDDIETNLTVLSGLLAPYRMRLTLCTSGEEAVALVKNKPFDFVLMDHMMPGMDGVEAVAQIRTWEEEQRRKNSLEFPKETQKGQSPSVFPKGIPIIALTANAVSGMREMFLEQGFDDFLSKPIEIAKLDELIAKWIPAEKKLAVRGREPGGADRGREKIEALPVIPGLDTRKGIAMTGGTESGYRKVLAQFYKDAADRLDWFRDFPLEPLPLPAVPPNERAPETTNQFPGGKFSEEKPDRQLVPNERTLETNDQFPSGKLDRQLAPQVAAFSAQAHAIKSAAGTIGAAEVSAEAAELEAAGKAGDMETVSKTLPLFREHLTELIGEIGKALKKSEKSEVGNEEGNARPAPSTPQILLAALRSALEVKNIKETDKLLAEIEGLPVDAKTRETINALSDQVLLGEYGKAVETLNILLAAQEQ
jgi:CheY-like chemotaxis protein